jgi:hypothetical protein
MRYNRSASTALFAGRGPEGKIQAATKPNQAPFTSGFDLPSIKFTLRQAGATEKTPRD